MFGSRRTLLNKVMKGVPLTFSRAGVAYDPANGNVIPANTPRFQTLGGKRGILIEEGTTNLMSGFASLPTNASMIMASTDGGGFTYSYDALNFPEKLQINSAVLNATYPGSKTYTITHSIVPISSGQPYTATIWGGSIGGTSTLIAINWFDSTSTYISSETKGITPNTAGKFTITGTAPANAVRGQAVIKGILNQGEKLFWNAGQLENKAFATSFTLGSTTRQGEVLSIDPRVLKLEECTIEFEVFVNDAFKNTANNKYGYIFCADDGTTNNIMSILHSPSGVIRPTIRGQNVLKYPTGVADANLSNGWHKFAVMWDKNNLSMIMDGDLGTKTSVSDITLIPSITRAMIGNSTTGNQQVNTVIRVLCFSKIKRTDADAQARELQNTYPIDNQVTAFVLLESDLRGVASA